MAFTPNYNLEKPTVGADTDVWGGKLNADLDIIDTTLFAKADKTNPVFTGSISAPVFIGTPSVILRPVTDSAAAVQIQTATGVALGVVDTLVNTWDLKNRVRVIGVGGVDSVVIDPSVAAAALPVQILRNAGSAGILIQTGTVASPSVYNEFRNGDGSAVWRAGMQGSTAFAIVNVVSGHQTSYNLANGQVTTAGLIEGGKYAYSILNKSTMVAGAGVRLQLGPANGFVAAPHQAPYVEAVMDTATTASLRFGTYNGTPLEVVRITPSGSIGVGTPTPLTRLDVIVPASAYDAALSGGGNFRLGAGIGNTTESLLFGVHSSGYSWIQAILPGTAARQLLLNPNGGNVGINSINPQYALDVQQGSAATMRLLNGGNADMGIILKDSVREYKMGININATGLGHWTLWGVSTGHALIVCNDTDIKLYLGGALKTLSVDASGFVKAA